MRILFLGDIVGRPGRSIVRAKLNIFRENENIDLVIANGENSAAGSGLTPRISEELFDGGVDVLTSGDHIWKKREIYEFLEGSDRIIRPLNYPEGAPGKGSTIINVGNIKVAVVNLLGRVFMDAVECPFVKGRREAERLKEITPIIIVDMHAEATSEKIAMGWYLDGIVSAVIGTHTHIQTADEKILPRKTAYITDSGMTGPYDSVIGRKKECVLDRFLTQLPSRFEMAEGDIEMHGVIVDVDEKTGNALKITRIQIKS
ncbi:MAG: TIGR00282 family metallophosphoesterase [Candidatus Omnitrophota bacterium]|nr:TIGR00282 family metallophosphoesterase [Candidatus Omnitrophota bacterium]MBU1894639.1 TIGR00282 family metallophosphoesterase [Candidatus Omnitrophota bacterium]